MRYLDGGMLPRRPAGTFVAALALLACVTLAFAAAPAQALVGVCTGDFFCSGKPTCASTAECSNGAVCIIDSCCGPGVCVSPDHLCNGGGSGSACNQGGICPAFPLVGCGTGDSSCQTDVPGDTVCFSTDFIPGGHLAPALSPRALLVLAGAMAGIGMFGLRKLRPSR